MPSAEAHRAQPVALHFQFFFWAYPRHEFLGVPSCTTQKFNKARNNLVCNVTSRILKNPGLASERQGACVSDGDSSNLCLQ